jgi:hypothetical protein
VTGVAALTPLVVMAKVAVVAPAATVTLAGIVAAALLLDKVIRAPPAGAILPKVTVPVDPFPPTTAVGFTVTLESVGGLIVSVAVFAALKVPVIVTVAAEETPLVVTVNVAVVAPAATVTLAGVVEKALSSDSVTTAPPVGAALLSVTVPVDETPPFTLVGFIVKLDSVGATIVKVAVCVTPERVAVIVEDVLLPTATVVTVNVAVVDPAATVTLAGVVEEALLSDKVTSVPPVGAAPVRVTVPVEELPPVTLAGLMATLASAGGLIVTVAVCEPL